MPIEKMAIILGKVVIKVIACLWVKKPEKIADIGIDSLGDLFEQFTSNFFVAEGMKNKLSPYATQIGQNIASYLRNVDKISDYSKESITKEVYRILDETAFSMESFAQWNYHYDAMTNFLFEHAVLSGYSEKECDVLKRCLEITSRYILSLLPSFPEFEVSFATTILERFDEKSQLLLDEIDKLGKNIEQTLSGRETRFESSYRECLKLEYGKINMFAANIDDSIAIYDLPEAYVYLRAKTNKKQQLEISELFELMGKKKQSNMQTLLIVGDAGAGKTTLLQWIAVKVAQHTLDKKMSILQGLFPVFIPLRRINNWESSIIENVITNLLAPYSIPLPNTWVENTAEKGQFLLLIDGLDELSADNRASAIKWLTRWEKKYPNNRIIITSRPLLHYSGISNVCKAQILPMNKNQILMFITNWHRSVLLKSLILTEEKANYYKKRTRSAIFSSEDLIGLARNPLLCALLCALSYRRNGTIPKNRNELYEECTKMLLEDREVRRDIGRDSSIKMDYTTKALILDDISYWMMRNDMTEADKTDLIHHLENKLPAITGIPKDVTAKDIIDFLVLRSGLLREPEEGKIEFVHLTFMEYMAAREISHLEDWNLLLHNSLKTKWRETILLAIAFANCTKASQFVQELINKSRRTRNKKNKAYYALLALSCSGSSRELIPECRNEVISMANTYIPPANDNWIYIQNLGSWVIPHLENKSNHSEKQKLQCIQFLNNQFSSVTLVNALKTYISPDEDFDVVSSALLALYDCNASHINQTDLELVVANYLEAFQNTKKALTVLDTFFDLCTRLKFSKQYSFSEVSIISGQREVSYRYFLQIKCKRLTLHEGVTDYSILDNFSHVDELIIYCDSNARTETLHKYNSLADLKKISYIIKKDAFILMGSDPILQNVEYLNIVFDTSEMEFSFDTGYYKYHDGQIRGISQEQAKEKLGNIKYITLNFIGIASTLFEYNRYICLHNVFMYFNNANIEIRIDSDDILDFISETDFGSLSNDEIKKITFKIRSNGKIDQSKIENSINKQNKGAKILFWKKTLPQIKNN